MKKSTRQTAGIHGAVFDHYIDRVVIDCMNQVTPKWSAKLAAYDVYIWDQCYSMEQSLRIGWVDHADRPALGDQNHLTGGFRKPATL